MGRLARDIIYLAVLVAGSAFVINYAVVGFPMVIVVLVGFSCAVFVAWSLGETIGTAIDLIKKRGRKK